MTNLRDTTILDVLPDRFLTNEMTAYAKAVQRLMQETYDVFLKLLFWGDIDNASDITLNAMAAELDAPFYESSMPIEQRRSIIKATFNLNSSIGTTYAVRELIAAAFGGSGSVSEWYEYGGKPYYFKTTVATAYPSSVTKEGFNIFANNINRIKPKRAKHEAVVFTRSNECKSYIAMGVISIYKSTSIPAVVPEI